MVADLTVRQANSADNDQWNNFVLSIEASNHSYLFNWSKVIENTFKQRPLYLLAESASGQIEGVLPLVHFKSSLFGNSLTSVPFLNAGGILAASDRAKFALKQRLVELHNKLQTEFVEIRSVDPEPILADTFNHSSHKVAYELELAPPVELFSSFSKKLRAQIKRPQKAGYSTQFLKRGVESSKFVDDFYRVFSRNMRDLGTPVYTRDFFTNLLSEFSENAMLAIVYGPSGPAACGLLIGSGARVEMLLASSIRKFNSDAPNMLLYWEAMQWAFQNGYRIFDFGRSTPDSGPAKFKEQWGAVKRTLNWYYYPATKAGSAVKSGDEGSFGLAVRLWRLLPVPVANLIGPHLSRLIP